MQLKVSVPLRGKEGAGRRGLAKTTSYCLLFPSPCGVRRVRDEWQLQSLDQKGP